MSTLVTKLCCKILPRTACNAVMQSYENEKNTPFNDYSFFLVHGDTMLNKFSVMHQARKGM